MAYLSHHAVVVLVVIKMQTRIQKWPLGLVSLFTRITMVLTRLISFWALIAVLKNLSLASM